MIDTDYFVPLKECSVNIQGEYGHNWGGLDHLFTENQLSNKIYCVTVSLFHSYDENGKPENYGEDNFFVDDESMISVLGIDNVKVCLENHAKHDVKGGGYWFTNKNNAKKIANYILNELKKKGFQPFLDV